MFPHFLSGDILPVSVVPPPTTDLSHVVYLPISHVIVILVPIEVRVPRGRSVAFDSFAAAESTRLFVPGVTTTEEPATREVKLQVPQPLSGRLLLEEGVR